MGALDVAHACSVLLVYTLVVISPGPNFVLVSNQALHHGRKTARAAGLGIALAAVINASLAMFGVTQLVVASTWMMVMVALVCSAVLLHLAWASLRRALAALSLETGARQEQAGEAVIEAASPVASLGRGWLVNATNPKGLLFFVGLFAQMMVGTSLATKVAVIAPAFLIEVVWYWTVAEFLDSGRARSIYTACEPAFEILVSVAFIAMVAAILTTVDWPLLRSW